MPTEPWIWSTILMFVGMGLIILEVFIPSGGILGTLATGAICASIGIAFYYSGARTGAMFLAVGLAGVPVTVAVAISILPHTPMGNRLLLAGPAEEEVLPDNDELVGLQDMVGRIGRAKTVMLPGGVVEIDGASCDALSEGGAIELNQPVRVIAVRTNRLVVRRVDESEADLTQDDGGGEEDILSRPVESLDIDPFADPTA